MSGKPGDPSNQGAAESVLLLPSDLGAGWKTAEQLAAESGQTLPQSPSYDVPVASIDPGIEDPDARCGVARLTAVPDGVKLATASSFLISEEGGTVIAAAAVFPAEANARARFDAYVAAMRGCPDELRIGIDDANAPPGLKTTIDVEQLELPPGAFGLRTRTGIGGFSFDAYTSVDMVVRRGRMIAGFWVTQFLGGRATPDITALTELIAQRLEAAEASLPAAPEAVLVFSPDAASQKAASAALTKAGDYPAEWSAPLPPVVIQPGSLSVDLAPGGRMFLRSDSPDCSASKLAPAPGMLARAGTGLMRVGRDHYVWHYAAVFERADDARDTARRVIEASKRCGEENAASRSPDADIAWEPVSLGVRADEVSYLAAGVQRWRIEGHDRFAARDAVSTDVFAVLRRGRLVATFEFNATGDDLSAAQDAVRTAIARLGEGEALLR